MPSAGKPKIALAVRCDASKALCDPVEKNWTDVSDLAPVARPRSDQPAKLENEHVVANHSITVATAALVVARLIFAGVFLMAVTFKFMGMDATAGYIAAAGFPFPLLLAWCAAILEVALVLCFLTGAFFSQAALVAAAYVLFLGFAFHGPRHWAGNQAEFGFFIDHFSFLAGLLFAAVHGPGKVLSLDLGWPGRA